MSQREKDSCKQRGGGVLNAALVANRRRATPRVTTPFGAQSLWRCSTINLEYDVVDCCSSFSLSSGQAELEHNKLGNRQQSQPAHGARSVKAYAPRARRCATM